MGSGADLLFTGIGRVDMSGLRLAKVDTKPGLNRFTRDSNNET